METAMTKEQYHEPPEQDFISSWLNLAASFWSGSPTDNKQGKGPGKADAPHGDKNFQAWQRGLNNLTLFIKLMGLPENQASLINGMESLGEMIVQLSGDSVENTIEFQGQLLKILSLMGQRTEPYTFDDTEQNIFEPYRTLYEQEVQKYLRVPQLGLPKFHQESLSKLMDTFNIFSVNLSELAYLFSVPMYKTSLVMQEKMEERLNNGDFSDDITKAYDEWVKVLEGHYMVLLKSKKYILVLKQTIDSLAEYRKTRDEAMCRILKLLPIPTNREMDDVYKELYTIKRQLRQLSNEMSKLKKTDLHRPL